MPPATQIRGTQIADDSLNAADVVYSLDDAYDNGGAGLGRIITADAGSVVVNGGSGTALVVSGTLELYGPSATGPAIKIVRGDLELNNAIKLEAGNGQNLQIFHDGANAAISNNTGHLLINSPLNGRIELTLSGTTSSPQFRVRRNTGSAVETLLQVQADGSVIVGSGTLGSTTISHDITASSNLKLNGNLTMGSNVTISSGSEGLYFSDQFGSRTLTQLRAGAAATPAFFYGDGVDGDLTVTTTYIATRELFFQNLTISSGAIFKPSGYRIFVRDTLTIESGGSYNDNGSDAVGMTSGSLMITRGFLDARTGPGGMGRNTTGPGIAGTGPTAGRTPRNAAGVVPAGGKGGDCAGQTGGNGGTGSTGVGAQWGSSWMWGLNGVQGGFAGAMGGGGGACNTSGGPATSGGGGGGAGIIWLAAANVVNSGTISCNGGGGGAAVSSGGSAGGGAGGGGGFLCLVTNTPSSNCGTVVCNGGLGGAGAGTGGMAGATGTVGYPLIFSYGDVA